MKALELLLQHYWIIKQETPDMYYQVKDGLKECKKFIQEKLGYNIIVNPYIIKLEKTTSQVEPWMGIQQFTSIKEYQILCYILMFLEDKEIEQQFILSDITEFISMQFEEGEIDWTVFTTRKQLVRVIKYCLEMVMIKENEGHGEYFSKDIETEVLYENTGISKYFVRSFGMDIMGVQRAEALEESSVFDIDEDRGLIRRQRIYRRLLLSSSVYRDDDKHDDFTYIRNYRYQIEKDFQSILRCDLHVHRASAYLVLEDMPSFGRIFPRNNALDEMLCYLFGRLQKRIRKQEPTFNEQYIFENTEFRKYIEKEIDKIKTFLPKTYQIKATSTLAEEAIETMHLYGCIKEVDNTIIGYPMLGKITGKYNIREDAQDE